MPPGNRELRSTVRAWNARFNCAGAVDHPYPSLGSKAFHESLPLRTRATAVVPGALFLSHSLSRAHRSDSRYAASDPFSLAKHRAIQRRHWLLDP
jgi:hypothetical protein